VLLLPVHMQGIAGFAQLAEAMQVIVLCWCLQVCMVWSAWAPWFSVLCMVLARFVGRFWDGLLVWACTAQAQLRPSCICLWVAFVGQHVPVRSVVERMLLSPCVATQEGCSRW